jgi:molybdenum cofactor cytidylyltransferase
VLAGGASTRMQFPKALLRAPDGQSFLARIVSTLLQAGFVRVFVVTGHHHGEIAQAVENDQNLGRVVCLCQNPEPHRGQLSSLLVGMEHAVDTSTLGVLVTLVDLPMVTPETVGRLLAAWQSTAAPIVRPVVEGSHGHPVIFSREVFDALRSAPLDTGAKPVVRAYEERIENVVLADPGCLFDIDTPTDYSRLLSS